MLLCYFVWNSVIASLKTVSCQSKMKVIKKLIPLNSIEFDRFNYNLSLTRHSKDFLLIMIFLILLKGYVCKLNSICLLSSKDSFCIAQGFLPICLQSICFRRELDNQDAIFLSRNYFEHLHWTNIMLNLFLAWLKRKICSPMNNSVANQV